MTRQMLILLVLMLVTPLPGIAQETPVDLVLTNTLDNHELPINDLAFSPDGSLLASASDDLTTTIWQVDTGDVDTVLEGQLHPVRSVAFSPDGNTVLTTGFNGIAFLWDLRSLTRADSINLENFPSMSDGAFSPDGTQFALAVGTGDVVIYDTETREQVTTFDVGDALLVERVSWSDDGTRLIAGYGFPYDSAVVWDMASGDLQFSMGAGEGTAFGLDIAPDGITTAVGSGEGSVLVWALNDETDVALLHDMRDAHPGGTFDLAFSPDGATLATVGFDGFLRLWDVASGDMLAEVTPTDEPRSLLAVAWGPEGDVLTVAGETGDVFMYELLR